MKMFSHIKLTNELKLLLLSTFGIIIILYFALPDYYYGALHVQAQLQQEQQQLPPIISVKITSPVTNQVPVGQLTISGISTDNATSDCTVYADWNNTKPFQKAVATGPGGANDYSTWTFTYTDKYHLITNGTNDLTSKLSCLNNGSNGVVVANITKSYSIIVIGIMGSSQRPASSAPVEGQQNNASGSVSSSLSPLKEDNNNTKTTTSTTSPESIPSVPITPSPPPSSPPPSSPPSIQEQPGGKDTVVVPNQEPQPQPAPANNGDTNLYWDIQ
jgi:hypothetical protein